MSGAKLRYSVFSVLVAVGVAVAATVHAQADTFFQGKNVRIVVGFSPGGIVDLWARFISRHMGRHVPGNPNFIVQNMPGGGSKIAANYVHNIAKPDGLTLGMFSAGLAFEQLLGREAARFDWEKFTWIGSPVRTFEVFYVRSATGLKSVEDIRTAVKPVSCGATGPGTTSDYFPKLVEQAIGVKFHMVYGYPGVRDIDIALERGEVDCAAATNELFNREPGRTWLETGFIRVLVQGGATRHPKFPDAPTIYELMEKHKTPEETRGVAELLRSVGEFGRPLAGAPGIPPDRAKMLRQAYEKALTDPSALAEAKKMGWEVEPTSGEKLQELAKRVIAQPPEVIAGLKKILGK
jgi:tripartite-type tricarboxylate transporter receptor subunit TctC